MTDLTWGAPLLKLEDLQPDATVRGILPDAQVTVVSTSWHGSNALTLVYRGPNGRVADEILYRHDEPRLEMVEAGRPWSFDGDGALFRLVAEAHRIRLAHLFDPVLAVHTSLVEPLPHQITAVYESMLPRQPLRFLLADDPGAGKTIMAGLLIKELIARGDLKRCLIVCPGSLVEQWQDELHRRFHLPFEILTNDKLEAARTGNWFLENDLAIARLDKLSRNEDARQKLGAPECRYDLIVCDEAHKLSATFFGGEIKYTKRYRLGQLLSGLTRHFLLMTATPHNGKEEDFQLFLALLDGDRFEGRFRDGVHQVEVSDLMRRMVKENLLKFDGRPLFPERIAYTVPYKLSDAEARLYQEVTEYVREEFNRAEALQNEKRAGTVGFALTILQRRLASSPEAIYQSLRRRRARLEKRLRELELLQRGAAVAAPVTAGPVLDADDVEDLEEAPENEVEAAEEAILDQATAAATVAELKAEIATLARLEALAAEVRRSGQDTKWRELAHLLGEIFTPAALATRVSEPAPPPYGAGPIPKPVPSPRQKFVLFTEHRDTLAYLERQIGSLLGRPQSVVLIHGGMGREERRKAQESFLHDPEVQVLLATDAAGEGINLQRAHLMVNYDLPWNPNRLEQRFGRIHRIGQTEVCHLWNLVAEETREGDVYRRLLEKLEEARQALGGQVFDVLGKLQFDGRPLRDLLIEAIRYGDQPEVRARLTRAIEHGVDRPHLEGLIEERALAHDAMDSSRVARVREEMERAEARRLQPHYIESFFLQAFKRLGGTIRQREPRRYEITNVPAPVRNRDRQIGAGDPVLARYERIAFEKDLIAPPGQPLAAFVCPGHPLLDAALDLTLERHRDLLKRGTVLVDERDPGTILRVLFTLEHAIQDASLLPSGERRTISRRLLYVEMDAEGRTRHLQYAPYVDYRPLAPDGSNGEPAAADLLARLMAIVAEGDRGRVYLSPTPEMEDVALSAKPHDVPETDLPAKALGFRVQEYGMTKWRDLFTPRQLVALTTFADLVQEACERVQRDALAAGLPDDKKPLRDGGTGATAYAEAVGVYLGFNVSKFSDLNNNLVTWKLDRGCPVHLFARQAIPMVWDYPEANPFSESSGSWDSVLWHLMTSTTDVCLPAIGRGDSSQQDAATSNLANDKVVSTDPPYYDNIGYADLSDFFYLWLRRSLQPVFPDLFATLAVPKAEELVATSYRHGDKQKAETFFLDGMTQAMHRLADQSHPAFPVTIYYAFKQAESDSADGTASTGWETFLDAVIHAGFAISGTWPIRTKMKARQLAMGTNALVSSIILVCRPREASASTATRREFVSALKAELPQALAHLQRGSIAPVDLAQAAIGPGMAVYTRFRRVLDAEGRALSVREALSLINQTLDEALAEQEGDFDADTRWTLAWFEQHGFSEGEYGVAETLSKAKNTSVGGMVEAGILASKRGKVRLLPPDELPADWDPATDPRLTAWEIVHHLIRVLESGGESAAAVLLAKLGAQAEVARELCYRLYTVSERKKRAQEALRYNALVQSWLEIYRLAREAGTHRAGQTTMFGGDEA